jgi:rhodanese-related sulfurtransferase
MCPHCDRSGVEHLIGSKAIGRIGWRIAPIRNDASGWQSRAAAHIFPILRFQKGLQVATTLKQLIDAANAAVPRITPARAREMIAQGNTLVLDVREPPEVEKTGKVAGAVNVSRSFLEFRADPESPSHDKNFAKDKSVIVYCASGGRAALSGKLLKDMGYEQVYNLGGFKDWADAGGEVEK